MKTLFKLIVLTTSLISNLAFAQSQSVDSFRFNCNSKKMPSQQAFAKVTGINNLAEVYDQRIGMRVNLLRECHKHKVSTLIVQFQTQNIQTIAKK